MAKPTEYLVTTAIGRHAGYGDGEYCVIIVTDSFYAVECDRAGEPNSKVLVEFVFEVVGDQLYKLEDVYILKGDEQ